jgi:hypothetical protein
MSGDRSPETVMGTVETENEGADLELRHAVTAMPASSWPTLRTA